jgi:anaerobic ribonucleoside-triphosphate reductase
VNENEKTRVKAIKTEVYSRIVGYYRPVQDWHLGKQQEFKERAVLSNMDIERAVNQPEPKGE